MVEQDARIETDPNHPGMMVAEYLEFHGWTQRDLARRTGLTPKTVNEICKGKARVSPPTALALEVVFRRPAQFWLNLQIRYDEAQARRAAMSKLDAWQGWVSRFPIAEMHRYRYFDSFDIGDPSTTNALLSFFGVSSPEGWQSVWSSCNVAYRQTVKSASSTEAISAWTRAAELEGEGIQAEPFDEKKLRTLIPDLRKLTRKGPEVFLDEVESLCSSAGVAVVWIPELPKTGISGCSRWLSDAKALVALTLRYKTDDQLWFTFFHELGHILLHRKDQPFILDNADTDLLDRIVDPEMQRLEEEASRFATDTLIPPDDLSRLIKSGDFSNSSIKSFAEDIDIGPGIVIGRLQHENILQHFQGNKLKRRFDWQVRDA